MVIVTTSWILKDVKPEVVSDSTKTLRASSRRRAPLQVSHGASER